MSYQTIDTSPPVLASPVPGRLCRIGVPAAGVAADMDKLWQDALLNLKGFHARQTYRIAHVSWQCERKERTFTLTSHAAATCAVDMHPAARIGSGVMLDHGTGIVIGETAVIEDDVSILQNVTLGGTGREQGDRHPKIRSGVMIGAGAKILRNIEIGAMSKIAAGNVVLKDMPAHCSVVGIPGRVARPTARARTGATRCPIRHRRASFGRHSEFMNAGASDKRFGCHRDNSVCT